MFALSYSTLNYNQSSSKRKPYFDLYNVPLGVSRLELFGQGDSNRISIHQLIKRCSTAANSSLRVLQQIIVLLCNAQGLKEALYLVLL